MNKLQDFEDSDKKLITIAISKENYNKLKMLGYTGQSFNDVLTRLLSSESRGDKE